jgi:uncharacterized secreted protein with C-terminal beta-propeller domain
MRTKTLKAKVTAVLSAATIVTSVTASIPSYGSSDLLPITSVKAEASGVSELASYNLDPESYKLADLLSITKIVAGKKTVPIGDEFLKLDANYDGVLDKADAALIASWLTGQDLELAIQGDYLRGFSSYSSLMNKLKSNAKVVGRTYYEYDDLVELEYSPAPTAAETQPTSADGTKNNSATGGAGSEENPDFVGTITQVFGVEEPDMIKTDGKTIYAVYSNYGYNNPPTIYAANVKNGEFSDFTIAKVPLPENVYSYNGSAQIFLKDGTLTLMCTGYTREETVKMPKSSYNDIIPYSSYYYTSTPKTYVFTYSTDGSRLTLTGSYFQEGSFSDARMIDDVLYLITNKYIQLYYYYYDRYFEYYMTDDGDYSYEETVLDIQVPPIDELITPEKCLPNYGSLEEGGKIVAPGDILLPSEWQASYNSMNFSVISGLNINDIENPVSIKALADFGGQIYCSLDNLYTATYKYQSRVNDQWNSTGTRITRIALDNGIIKPEACGVVEGTVKDQFSMDQYQGDIFRIATTTNRYTYAPKYLSESYSSVFTLDKDLKIIGSVSGLGIGEQIKSVSFQGNTGYVVTFRQTDPLYSIDMTDPRNLVLLDELKIDGFSTYMHNWADGLLLGFGNDADPDTGRVTGLKLTMFDVSDTSDLKDITSFIISSNLVTSNWKQNYSYVYSNATWDHKYLLLDGTRNFIAFPVSRYAYGYDENNKYRYENTNSYVVCKYIDGEFEVIADITLDGYFNRSVYIDGYVYLYTSKQFIAVDLSTGEVTSEIYFDEG